MIQVIPIGIFHSFWCKIVRTAGIFHVWFGEFHIVVGACGNVTEWIERGSR